MAHSKIIVGDNGNADYPAEMPTSMMIVKIRGDSSMGQTQPFQRLISNGSTVFVGVDREDAEINAANGTGGKASIVPRLSATWPALKKYDNDVAPGSPSPFNSVPNPEYIWQPPITDGQTAAFAIASDSFTANGVEVVRMSVNLAAFADNAMETKITLFERKADTTFAKVEIQPNGLNDYILISGTPNTPATGLTEFMPFNWQNIRVYSTFFAAAAIDLANPRVLKVVISFEPTNYLPSILGATNPAGLQFIVDLYKDVDIF